MIPLKWGNFHYFLSGNITEWQSQEKSKSLQFGELTWACDLQKWRRRKASVRHTGLVLPPDMSHYFLPLCICPCYSLCPGCTVPCGAVFWNPISLPIAAEEAVRWAVNQVASDSEALILVLCMSWTKALTSLGFHFPFCKFSSVQQVIIKHLLCIR